MGVWPRRRFFLNYQITKFVSSLTGLGHLPSATQGLRPGLSLFRSSGAGLIVAAKCRHVLTISLSNMIHGARRFANRQELRANPFQLRVLLNQLFQPEAWELYRNFGLLAVTLALIDRALAVLRMSHA